MVLSDGIHSLLGQFTDLTFSREENKNKVIRCGFFNLSNGIFWVLYEKFDWIILKIWSLLLFSQSVRELMGDWKEGSVNRRRREWIPSDNTLIHTLWFFLWGMVFIFMWNVWCPWSHCWGLGCHWALQYQSFLTFFLDHCFTIFIGTKNNLIFSFMVQIIGVMFYVSIDITFAPQINLHKWLCSYSC